MSLIYNKNKKDSLRSGKCHWSKIKTNAVIHEGLIIRSPGKLSSVKGSQLSAFCHKLQCIVTLNSDFANL